jgi:small subunit ribosomal protein S1
MDRARGERGWRVLQDYLDNGEAFEGYVTGSNKGGLLVNVEGVNAFVPLSQIVAGPERGNPEATQTALAQWVGKNITLKVIELNRRRNRAILSERSAVQEKRAAEKERLLLELQEGDIRTGRITSIRDFGIFVDIGGADGLVHLSELSWERTPRTPHEFFKVGDEIPVYVLKVDNEAKKIALSVRRAQPERWEEIVSSYREGQIVPGQVTKLAPFGAFVRLEGPIEGLIHISELVDRRITHPREVVEENDVVPVKIVRIEYDRHRLGLSFKQARESAEEDGWAFSAAGSTTLAPQDALDRLGLAAMPQRAAPPEDSDYTGEAPAPEAEAPEEAATEPEQPADVEAGSGEAAPEAETVAETVAVEVDAETAVEASEPAAEAEIAASEAEAPEEAAAEPEQPADVEAGSEDAAPGPEASAEEAAVEMDAADANEEAPSAEAEAVPEPEAEQTTPEEQPETSFEEGIEAAAEGAAPDVTESASDAFNKAGESE